MEMENPPTSASEMTSLPAMSRMRFAKDLHAYAVSFSPNA
ncbi:hypothetical protein PC116_g22074 [Phytophthora cactorum]|nr:hypothetical protein PC114_g19672 [Phytophthora cactorum]KAG2973623.1 hypothetical protein PC119_g22865 [Phytophthora cactorum]KAG3130759.1 hypothetical protein C6341_g23623 [Phytophthora cactorum]KAG4229602.1 hypothetical protein PC116_g22074 [Phytophthora cactorum]